MIDEYLVELLNSADFVSGEQLAHKLGVSRAAVWKKIKQLNENGVATDSLRGCGYRLDSAVNLTRANAMSLALKSACSEPVSYTHKMVTGSTNSDVLESLKVADTCAVVSADMQLAGKGRRGRVWVSPFGSSLYLSVGKRYLQGAQKLDGLSIAVGVEVATVLKELGLSSVALKWPNDILVGDAKLGGILIELVGEAGGGVALVVGVGINFRLSKEITQTIDQKATDLHSQLSSSLDKTDLTSAIAVRLVRLLARFEKNGLEEHLESWKSFDACMGKQVSLLVGEKEHKGMAAGVTQTGGLRLVSSRGVEEFYGGEVSLRLKKGESFSAKSACNNLKDGGS